MTFFSFARWYRRFSWFLPENLFFCKTLVCVIFLHSKTKTWFLGYFPRVFPKGFGFFKVLNMIKKCHVYTTWRFSILFKSLKNHQNIRETHWKIIQKRHFIFWMFKNEVFFRLHEYSRFSSFFVKSFFL